MDESHLPGRPAKLRRGKKVEHVIDQDRNEEGKAGKEGKTRRA